jgi:lysozyme
MTESSKRTVGVALGAALVGSLLSIGGVALVQKHEGLRYAAYPDPGTGGAPYTICYGHTKGVRPGMVATHDQCTQWLREDLMEAELAVRKYVKTPLTQNEYDVYTSFVFNAGAENFRTSTMLKLINQKRWTEACNQLPRWVYADKRKLNGLVKRRYEERVLCIKPSKVVYHGHK